MQYYVIGPDGNKYGPADVATLKSWITENRLTPQSMLEDFNTGQRLPASSVPGLFDAAQTATATGPNMGPATGTMYSNPPTPGTVYNPNAAMADNGQSELTLAWVFNAIGFVLCGCGWIFGPLGIWKANQAMVKGNPSASAARICGIIVTVWGVAWFILRIGLVIAMITARNAAGQNPFGQP